MATANTSASTPASCQFQACVVSLATRAIVGSSTMQVKTRNSLRCGASNCTEASV